MMAGTCLALPQPQPAGMFADDGIQPELALVIRQFNAHHDSLAQVMWAVLLRCGIECCQRSHPDFCKEEDCYCVFSNAMEAEILGELTLRVMVSQLRPNGSDTPISTKAEEGGRNWTILRKRIGDQQVCVFLEGFEVRTCFVVLFFHLFFCLAVFRD